MINSIQKRNGESVPFDPTRIRKAIYGAFWEEFNETATKEKTPHKKKGEVLDQKSEDGIEATLKTSLSLITEKGATSVEDIQNLVEMSLYREGFPKIAHRYVVYRLERNKEREISEAAQKLTVTKSSGEIVPYNPTPIINAAKAACAGVEEVSSDFLYNEIEAALYDGISTKEITESMLATARTLIEKEPSYSLVTARLLLQRVGEEAFGELDYQFTAAQIPVNYNGYFQAYIQRGVELQMLRPEMLEYNLEELAKAIAPGRDLLFHYLGLKTLYDRYLVKTKYGVRIEMPQAFWMRVAMGLARLQPDKNEAATRYYNVLSELRGVSSTPTLFNAGTNHEQLSSCYLLTVDDTIEGIFKNFSDNARLSKWAGGIGNDWTAVRGRGGYIKGTNGESQGGVPWWKITNDTAVAVNQSFTADTLLVTSKGIEFFEETTEKSLLLNEDGHFDEIKEVHKYVQEEPVVEVHSQRMIIPTRVCQGHEYLVIEGPKKRSSYNRFNWEKAPRVWKEAKTLTETDFILHRIPKKSETHNPLKATKDNCLFYGMLLGDGHCRAQRNEAGISGDDVKKKKNFEFVRNYLTKKEVPFWEYLDGKTRYISWTADKTPFSTRDMLYDGEGNKTIHPSMLHLPEKETAFLMEGLFQTDGYNKMETGTPTFTNSSIKLCEGLRFIAKRLGILSSGHKRKHTEATFTKRGGDKITIPMENTGYSVTVSLTEKAAKYLGRKTAKVKNWIEVDGFLAERVTKVIPTIYTGMVYDVRMTGTPSYNLCNGIVHNGSKRKGAICNYLETWHIDLLDFLDLRKNTGDERSRTHDLNTANWVPDLFMKRLEEEESTWWMLSPETVPDLHDLYGAEFEKRYLEIEKEVMAGPTTTVTDGNLGLTIRTLPENKYHPARRVDTQALWRKMLTSLFETGHPWIVFKDPGNIRNPQDHAGVIHSSNLCTEIFLNTSASTINTETNAIEECGEVAVCNLASINLAKHIVDGKLNEPMLKDTARVLVEMLDNVIDINFYPIAEARKSNMQHRPIGLGVMGFHTAIQILGVPYASEDAIEFSDVAQEIISLAAIEASSDLAVSRGKYPSYEGSKWSRGILPLDSVKLIEKHRGSEFTKIDYSCTFPEEWERIREKVLKQGMRNSNVMAIAPTATIANISGVSEGITPEGGVLYTKENLSGTFTVCNPILVLELKKIGLWNDLIISKIKMREGSIQAIEEIPQEIRNVFKHAYEIPAEFVIEAASRRQKWIDQGQSCNLFVFQPTGKALSDMYRLAWKVGLKSTYYLRSKSASVREKTTVEVQSTGIGTRLGKEKAPSPEEVAACSLEAKRRGEECEACQ